MERAACIPEFLSKSVKQRRTTSRIVAGFFSPDDISTAKKLLVKQFLHLDGVGQFTTERLSSTVRLAHEAEVEDIVGIFEVADIQQALESCMFMASDFNQLPTFGPEEVNLAAVVERQVRLEGTIQHLSFCRPPYRSCQAMAPLQDLTRYSI